MKKKKVLRLQLNKSTQANLDGLNLDSVKGGYRFDTDRTCGGYCDSFVSCEWTLCPVCDEFNKATGLYS